MTKVVLAVLVVVLLVVAHAEEESRERIIEPKLKMFDRSPSLPGKRSLPSRSVGASRPSPPGRPMRGPARSPQEADNMDFDEAISFGVNTRGEFGRSRAPLFCNCRVLTVLLDSEANDGEEAEFPASRRSYTAPELRERTPLVTPEYAKENEQISFGVNIRGEEGPEFNPTWCQCQILQSKMSANDDEEEDKDDEDEDGEVMPHRPSGPSRGANNNNPHRSFNRPRPVVNLELNEGLATEAKTTAQTATQTTAQTTTHTVAQAQLQSQAQPLANPHHRHSWSVGVNIPTQGKTTQEKPTAELKKEFVFHGHSYSTSGKQVDSNKLGPIEMLAELDEGRDVPDMPVSIVDEPQAAEISPAEETASTDKTALVDDELAEPVSLPTPAEPTRPLATPNITRMLSLNLTNVTAPSATPAASASPSPSASASVLMEPQEDSEDEDPITALKNLAKSHPHASAILSQAIQAAAMQQQSEVQELKHEIDVRNSMIKKLAAERTNAQQAAQAQLKMLEKLEEMRLKTASPSPTPSNSPLPSPSPTPSSSPAAVKPVPHHYHRPRINHKACYQKCRDTQCQELFDQSLRQYASCMDQCAATCYGS